MHPAGRLRTRAWLAGLLLCAMAASALMQFGLAVLAPFITAEFGLSRTQYGSGVSTLFLSGVLVSLLAGRLVGRWGEVRLLRAVFAFALVAFVIMAVAPGWGWVLVAAMLMGIPLGLGNPVTNQLIVTRVDQTVQGTATGVKQSGVQVGALFAGAVVPPVAVAFGWRAGVGVLALVAVVGLLLAVPLRDTPQPDRFDGDGPPGRPSTLALFLCGYAALMGFAAAAVNAFLPLFAYEELAMSVSRAGQLVAVIGLLGALARVGMGVIGNRIRRFALWLAGLAAVAVAASALLLAASRQPGLVWLVVVGFAVSANAWQVAAMLAVVRQGRDAARSSGIVMGGFIGGMMLGPLTFGVVVDATRSYAAGWGMVVSVFAAALGLSVLVTVRAERATPRPLA